MAHLLLGAIGLDALGITLPGMGLIKSPVTAFNKDQDLDISTIVSLSSSCMCSTMMVMGMMKFPFKTPPMMMMLLFCCISSCFSTIMLSKDTYDRFTRTPTTPST